VLLLVEWGVVVVVGGASHTHDKTRVKRKETEGKGRECREETNSCREIDTGIDGGRQLSEEREEACSDASTIPALVVFLAHNRNNNKRKN
jgi:hypothetical protein